MEQILAHWLDWNQWVHVEEEGLVDTCLKALIANLVQKCNVNRTKNSHICTKIWWQIVCTITFDALRHHSSNRRCLAKPSVSQKGKQWSLGHTQRSPSMGSQFGHKLRYIIYIGDWNIWGCNGRSATYNFTWCGHLSLKLAMVFRFHMQKRMSQK